MSAAAKLNAMVARYEADEGWDSGPYGIAQRSVEQYLGDALPQIAAIVEGAEALPALFDVIEGSSIKTLSFVPLLDELDKALS